MQQHNQGPALWTVLSCSLAMALAGCSTSTTPTPGATPDFNGASTATASEISTSVGSMTMTQSTQSAGALFATEDAPAGHQLHPETAGAGCGTVVINSENGQDQITAETITYALPACKLTGIFGVDSLAITGTL
jgi:hypothetical protein